MEKVKYVKARAINWIVFWSAVAAIATVINLGLSWYNNQYPVNAQAATSFVVQYSKDKTQIATGTIELAKGTLTYGWTQTKGDKKCKYTLSYKKTNERKYKTLKNNYSFSKNNRHYGPYKIKKINGRTDYNIKCKKTAGKSTTSKIRIDFMIL